jgi:hypothetical protein
VKGLNYEDHHAVFSSSNYFWLLGQKVFYMPHSQTPSTCVLPEGEGPGFVPIQQKLKLCCACFIPLYTWWQTGKQNVLNRIMENIHQILSVLNFLMSVIIMCHFHSHIFLLSHILNKFIGCPCIIICHGDKAWMYTLFSVFLGKSPL